MSSVRGRHSRGGHRTNRTFSRPVPFDLFTVLLPGLQSQQPPRSNRRQGRTLVGGFRKIASLGAVNDWLWVASCGEPTSNQGLGRVCGTRSGVEALKSEEVAFGNPFVKVYWHRPLEGRCRHGTKTPEAPKTLVEKSGGNGNRVAARLVANGNAGPITSRSITSPSPKKPTASTSDTLQGLAVKQER